MTPTVRRAQPVTGIHSAPHPPASLLISGLRGGVDEDLELAGPRWQAAVGSGAGVGRVKDLLYCACGDAAGGAAVELGIRPQDAVSCEEEQPRRIPGIPSRRPVGEKLPA